MDAYLYPLTENRERLWRLARLRTYANTLATHEARAYDYAIAYAESIRVDGCLPRPSAFGLSRSEANAIAVRVANIILAS